MVRRRLFYILGLTFIALALSYYFQRSSKIPSKNVATYWRDANVILDLESTLLNDENCYSAERTFLGCIKAIESVSTLYQLRLNFNGYFKVMTKQDYDDFKYENKHLQSWTEYYQKRNKKTQLSFSKAWILMRDKLFSEKYKSYLNGIAINGYLSIVEDPHTYIIPKQWFLDRVTELKQSIDTFGFSIERNEMGYVVTKTEISELKKGDILLKVDHILLKSILMFEVQDLISSKLNEDQVIFEVLRGSQKIGITLKSKSLNLNSVESGISKRNSRVGYIKIRRYSSGVCKEVEKHIQNFQQDTPLGGLILDLRNNPGGIITEAGCTAGLFLGKNKLVYSLKNIISGKLSEHSIESYITSKKEKFEGTLMVLVNSESASAAEILAGALQDYKRAQIIGKPTFGKGSYQEGQIWSENDNMLFFKTGGLYFLPSGKSPQKIGIQPDIFLSSASGKMLTKVSVEPRGESQYWSALDNNLKADPNLMKMILRELHDVSKLNENKVGISNSTEFVYKNNECLSYASREANNENPNENVAVLAERAETLFQCFMISKQEGGLYGSKN
ncbi:MAG TPA: S41 family peptidase [Pseudobdellovibrionaceae bacterium]|nr:S41 family peptidase [Pseudobdellovibrionaceae bacterium]